MRRAARSVAANIFMHATLHHLRAQHLIWALAAKIGPMKSNPEGRAIAHDETAP